MYIVVGMNSDSEDRLKQLEILMEKKQRHSNRLCWIRWDPNSDFGYDIEDAREDIHWMIYEIRRLREENAELKAFADSFREKLEKEIGPRGKPPL